MHLRDLQHDAPWGTPDQVARDYQSHAQADDRQIAHTILHAVKAAGKLVELQEASEHTRGEPVAAIAAKRYVADLVIIALRLARLLRIDLEDASRRAYQRKASGVACGDSGALTTVAADATVGLPDRWQEGDSPCAFSTSSPRHRRSS